MNELHLVACASPEWAAYVEQELVPWATDGRELGDDVLEVGPGPGMTTEVLRRHVTHITAVEIDVALAAALTERMQGTNVTVVCADATETGLPAARFSAATCFTMLHHVPTPEGQDRLFAEVARVLQPGGLFVGTDVTDSPGLRAGHVDDIFVPVDPDTLPDRLATAGFVDITVELAGDRVRFAAFTPPD